QGRLFEYPGSLGRGEVLHADGGRPFVTCPAFRLMLGRSLSLSLRFTSGIWMLRPCIDFKPIGPLPSALLAEDRAELLQPVIGGREAQRARGLALLGGDVDVVILRVSFGGARERVRLAAVLRP